MRRSLHFCLVTALFCFVVSGIPPAAAKAAKKVRGKAPRPSKKQNNPATPSEDAQTPVWKPGAALTGELGPASAQYGFQINLPSGYTLLKDQFDRDTTFRQIAWNKETPDKSLFGGLSLLIAPTFAARTPEEAVSRYQKIFLATRFDDFTQGDMESGEINGLPFARMYWKGESQKVAGRKLHGFTYAAIDGTTLYWLSSVDVEPQHTQTLPLDEAAVETFRVQTATEQAALPLPELGKPQRIEPGILRYEVPLTRGRIATKLWIYLPEHPASAKIPCLFIAPAGTRLFHGTEQGEDARPEHLPYVRAGFAVVAYEIDGGLEEPLTNEGIDISALAFMNADAGLADARAALDYAVAKVPQIDPRRLYSAGHSSAATLSLLLAEHDARIKACIAYAPTTDLPTALKPEFLSAVEDKVPGFTDFIRRDSPNTGASLLRCPLFLFHADDDSIAPTSESLNFAQQVQQTNPQVTFIQVLTGDHYDSMIEQGIPLAIQWLKSLPQNPN